MKRSQSEDKFRGHAFMTLIYNSAGKPSKTSRLTIASVFPHPSPLSPWVIILIKVLTCQEEATVTLENNARCKKICEISL